MENTLEITLNKLKEVKENYNDYKQESIPNLTIKVEANDLSKIFNGDKALYRAYRKHLERVTLTLGYEHHYVGKYTSSEITFDSLKELTEHIINILEKSKKLGWIDNEWNISLNEKINYYEYESWLADVYLQNNDGGGLDIINYDLKSNIYNIPDELKLSLKKIEILLQEIAYLD